MNSFITVMHIDAHTILHCQLQNPLFLFQKVSLCFSEWADALSPSCRKCKRTSWKARVYMVPCKVRGELPSLSHSCHLLSCALVLQTLLLWGTGSVSLTGIELPFPKEARPSTFGGSFLSWFSSDWFIMWLESVKDLFWKSYDNL